MDFIFKPNEFNGEDAWIRTTSGRVGCEIAWDMTDVYVVFPFKRRKELRLIKPRIVQIHTNGARTITKSLLVIGKKV